MENFLNKRDATHCATLCISIQINRMQFDSDVDVRQIEGETLANTAYRKIVYTAKDRSMQIAIMSLEKREDVPREVHHDATQFVRVERGRGLLVVYRAHEEYFNLKDGVSVVIPRHTPHRIVNTSDTEPLKLYTIYTPAVHKDKERRQRQR